MVDEVDSNEVNVEVVADHELAQNLFLVFVFDWDRVDSIEPQVIVSDAFDPRGVVSPLVLSEVLVEGSSGQTCDRSLVSYSTGITTPPTVSKISCQFSLVGSMFRKDEQTLEKVFIDTNESE